MGLWSTLMTLSKWSRPSIPVQGAASMLLPFTWRATWAYRVSLIRVLLPEPETPVTQVNRPTGMSMVTSLRLLPLAPWMRSTRSGSAGLRRLGTVMLRVPDR